MEKYQVSYYRMVKTSILYLDRPTSIAIYGGNVPFTEKVAELKACVVAVDGLVAVQQENYKWVRSEKTRLRDTMTELAVNAAQRCYAYGVANHVGELKDTMNLSKSSFNKVSEPAANGLVVEVLSKCNKYLASLSAFGVTQALIDEMEDAQSDFTNFIGMPQEKISDRKEATKDLAMRFNEIREIFEVLDSLVNIFESDHPEFVSQYFIVRRIDDSPTHTTELVGLVRDSVSLLPLAGVNIVVHPSGETRLTGDSGAFNIINLAEGNIMIECSLPGYIPLSVPAVIVNNQTTEVTIDMVHE